MIVCFPRFFNVFWSVLGGLNYSQIANFDFRTYCNIFWIYGTFKKSSKSGPSDPVFITTIRQKVQEKSGNNFETYYPSAFGRPANVPRMSAARQPTCSFHFQCSNVLLKKYIPERTPMSRNIANLF